MVSDEREEEKDKGDKEEEEEANEEKLGRQNRQSWDRWSSLSRRTKEQDWVSKVSGQGWNEGANLNDKKMNELSFPPFLEEKQKNDADIGSASQEEEEEEEEEEDRKHASEVREHLIFEESLFLYQEKIHKLS